jgi:hypothetical protein
MVVKVIIYILMIEYAQNLCGNIKPYAKCWVKYKGSIYILTFKTS